MVASVPPKSVAGAPTPTIRIDPDRPAMFRDLRSRLLVEVLILGGVFGFVFGTTLGLSSSDFVRLLGVLLFVALVVPIAALGLLQMWWLRREVPQPLLLTSDGAIYDVSRVSLRRGGRLPWRDVGRVTVSEQWFDGRAGVQTVTLYHATFQQNALYRTSKRGAPEYIRVPFLRREDAEIVQHVARERAMASRQRATGPGAAPE